MKKLVLFDIDGTLIQCGKAPRRAISKAMELVYGTRGPADQYSFSGKTDPQILYEVMKSAQLDEDFITSNLDSALEQYVTFLDQWLHAEDITVLNGISSLLEMVQKREGAVLGLLTGNVIRGARIKLSRAGIDHFFFNGRDPVGAFGSDAMDRNELPQIAVQRAFKAHSHYFKEKEIVIIGDSPSDVLCGKNLNVCSVAVATGWHSEEELSAYQPDFSFNDLSDTERVLECILN